MTIDYKQKHKRTDSGRDKRAIEAEKAFYLRKTCKEKIASVYSQRKVDKALGFEDIFSFTPVW